MAGDERALGVAISREDEVDGVLNRAKYGMVTIWRSTARRACRAGTHEKQGH